MAGPSVAAVCGTCRNWGGHAYPDLVVTTSDGVEHHLAVGQCQHPANQPSWYSLPHSYTCALHETREETA